MEYYLGEILAFGFPRIPYGTAVCNGTTLPIQSNSALFSLFGTVWGGNGSSNFGIPNLKGRAMMGLGQATSNSGVPVSTLTWQIGNLFGTNAYQISVQQLPLHNHTAVFTPTTTEVTTPEATPQVDIAVAQGGHGPCCPGPGPIAGGDTPTAAYVQVSSAQATTNDPRGNYLACAWDPRTSTSDNVYVDPAHAGTLGNLAGVGGGTGGITGGSVAIGYAGASQPIYIDTPGAGVNFCVVTSGVYPSFE